MFDKRVRVERYAEDQDECCLSSWQKIAELPAMTTSKLFQHYSSHAFVHVPLTPENVHILSQDHLRIVHEDEKYGIVHRYFIQSLEEADANTQELVLRISCEELSSKLAVVTEFA